MNDETIFDHFKSKIIQWNYTVSLVNTDNNYTTCQQVTEKAVNWMRCLHHCYLSSAVISNVNLLSIESVILLQHQTKINMNEMVVAMEM